MHEQTTAVDAILTTGKTCIDSVLWSTVVIGKKNRGDIHIYDPWAWSYKSNKKLWCGYVHRKHAIIIF